MKRIKLTQGKWAIVDNEDYEKLNKWKWCYYGGYAIRTIRTGVSKRTKCRMHWEVIGKPKDGFEVDHINGNGLDNKRSNLRICTHRENTMNAKRHKDGKSGFKGVSWQKRVKKWQAQINIGGIRTSLGYFITVKEAAQIYNEAAKKYFKDFARLNKL